MDDVDEEEVEEARTEKEKWQQAPDIMLQGG